MIFYVNCLICHCSKIQRWTSTSTAGTLLVYVSRRANEVSYIKGDLVDLGVKQFEAKIFTDAQVALDLLKEVTTRGRTKHMGIKDSALKRNTK